MSCSSERCRSCVSIHMKPSLQRCTQFANRTEQVDADGRLTEVGNRGRLAGRMSSIGTEQKHPSLLRRELPYSSCNFDSSLPGKQRLLGVGRGRRRLGNDVRLSGLAVQDGKEPALSTLPRSTLVKATIYEDPGEPDFE